MKSTTIFATVICVTFTAFFHPALKMKPRMNRHYPHYSRTPLQQVGAYNQSEAVKELLIFFLVITVQAF